MPTPTGTLAGLKRRSYRRAGGRHPLATTGQPGAFPGVLAMAAPEPYRPDYDDQTNRIGLLMSFTDQAAYHAAPEDARLIDPLAGDDADDDVVSARDLALIAAYRAIRRIAEGS